MRAYTSNETLSRRRFLVGVGALVPLPFLESLANIPEAVVSDATPPLRRIVVLFVPNGIHAPAWGIGSDEGPFEPSGTLEPLAEIRQHVVVLSGLENANSVEGGGHYCRAGAILTGCAVRRTEGEDVHNGVSFDQVAADSLGVATRFRSLELGTEPMPVVSDQGYSPVYGGSISWSTAVTARTKEILPHVLFDRIFRPPGTSGRCDNRSVLDVVMRDAAELRRRVSAADRVVLEGYLESIREVESRLFETSISGSSSTNTVPEKPVAKEFTTHADRVRSMLDLLALALLTNETNVATFMFGNAKSRADMSFLPGVRGVHHELSHHGDDPMLVHSFQAVNRWHVDEYARFVRKIAAGREGDRSALDTTVVLLVHSLRSGDTHEAHNLPIVLAGGTAANHRLGRILRFARPRPLCDLYLSLLQECGSTVQQFGDGTNPVLL
jgi:hypothetical protein